jgi:SSS family solute:Na+ symporter
MSVYVLVIMAYFAVVVTVSMYTKKVASRSAADYLVAGRNMGLFVCGVVVASEWLGGLSTIGVSEQAFRLGSLEPILYNLATAIGMVIIGFTVASHYRLKKVSTVSEMVGSIFGPTTRHISAGAFLIAYLTLAYVELQTCASVMSPLFGLNWATAVIISAAIITAYTYVGGMHALAIAAILFLATRFLGLGTAFIIGLGKVGGFAGLQQRLIAVGGPANYYNPFAVSLSNAFSLLLGGILGGMAAQASIQPIFSAKDAATAKRASILAALFIAPYGLMTAYLGLMARTGMFYDPKTIVDAKTILPRLLTTPEFIPPILGGLALAGMLAAILSTMGPVNFAIVTIAAKDIYHGFINKDADDQKILAVARKLVILVSLATIPLAIFIRGAILESGYVSYAIRAIGAIVILFGIYKCQWVSSLAASLAFTIGTAATLCCVVANRLHWFTVDKTYGAVATTLLVLLLVNVYERLTGKNRVDPTAKKRFARETDYPVV